MCYRSVYVYIVDLYSISLELFYIVYFNKYVVEIDTFYIATESTVILRFNISSSKDTARLCSLLSQF